MSIWMSHRTLFLGSAALICVTLSIGWAEASAISSFTAGDLVIDTVTDQGGGLDTAAPIVLQEFSLGNFGTSAASVGSLALPQTDNGANAPISGEYGSASEGFLQLSGNGADLVMIGYGVDAATFNAAPATIFGTSALGQTTSLTTADQTGTPVTTVPRVVALIGANGSVDTSTALTGVFNTNNPRSVATADGSQIYVSGQGASKTDPTQGVFVTAKGATTAKPVDNSTETRDVQIINNGSGNTLYVSRDENPPGSGGQNFTNISTVTNGTGALPTSSAGLTTTHIIPPASPDSLGGNNGSINLSAGTANGINNSRIGNFVYLSPEDYFFANPDTLYVTDSGQPKNGNADKAALGEGGLQKWSLINGNWILDYDLFAGLNLVNNANANANDPTAPGVTGLFGLTGELVGNQVELFATSYGLNELSPNYLYEITDDLASMTLPTDEGFNTLYAAADNTSIRGVSFAPQSVPEPASLALLGTGCIGLGLIRRRRSKAQNRLQPALT